MKAFATYLLLLAALPMLIILSSPPPRPDYSASLSIEAAYYESAGLKDAILESVRLGAKDAKGEYAARHAAGERDIDYALLSRQKIRSRLILLSESLPESMLLWCGKFDSASLSDAAERTKRSKTPAPCEGCKPIASGECIEYIQFDAVAVEAWLERPSPASLEGAAEGVGFSSYSGSIGYSSFIPVSVRVDIR